MVKRIKQWGLCICALCLTLCAGGCMFNTGEDLYSLPQAPEDYLELQEQLNRIITGGAEYAAPQTGANTQTVQMVDLDGDGNGEAIAFFRESGKKRPLKIYIFRQTPEGYETAAVIEGEGAAVNSIVYSDITGDGWSEIVVSWQMSTKVQSMAAYSLKQYEVVQLMQTEYTKYAMSDLNQDGKMEIVALHVDTGEMGSRADYYAYEGGTLVQMDSVPLSSGVVEIGQVKTGLLYDGTPALFVDNLFGQGSMVTDLLAVVNGVFQNVTADKETGVSSMTDRTYAVYCGDLDGDGYLEVPAPERLPSAQPASSNGGLDVSWIIHWNLYDKEGLARRLVTTYHNYTDGWYLRLPQTWVEGGLAVSRQDVVAGERTIVFSIRTGEKIYTPFLKIYKLTGANREERAKLNGRFLLRRDSSASDTLYVAEFLNEAQTRAYHLDQETLFGLFQLIQLDWNTES